MLVLTPNFKYVFASVQRKLEPASQAKQRSKVPQIRDNYLDSSNRIGLGCTDGAGGDRLGQPFFKNFSFNIE